VNGNGNGQQEVYRPGIIPGRSSADDLMDKAQKAMLAIAEFMKEVREHQQARLQRSKLKIQHPVAPPRKNYTRTASTTAKAEGQPKCPDCGDEMRERTNAKNGSSFFGCINYPTCQATVDAKKWAKRRPAE